MERTIELILILLMQNGAESMRELMERDKLESIELANTRTEMASWRAEAIA